MKVIIATKNPGKIEGVKKSFENYFDDIEVEGISVPSNVNDQPLNEEIYIGAKNRISNLKKHCKENNICADMYVAIESGITNQLGRWMIINIATMEDNNNFESYGCSAGFPVPDKYVDNIISTELGVIMDNIFKENNLRLTKGGISFLTHNKVSRIDLTEQAFNMALTKYINGDIWR